MSEGSTSLSFNGDGEEQDTGFPFYRLDTGRRKYQQRRLKPQAELLEREAAVSGGGSGGGDDKFTARPSGRRKKKFVGVRQRSSGRWVAEIKDTTQKIRLWLGTFDTAEDAARAYDEAACMLRGVNTRTNFLPVAAAAAASSSGASLLPSKAARALHQRLKSAKSAKSFSGAAAAKIDDKEVEVSGQYDFNQLGQYFEEHGPVQAQPLHVQSFTSLLSSDKFFQQQQQQRDLSGFFSGKMSPINQDDHHRHLSDTFDHDGLECVEQEHSVLPVPTFLEPDHKCSSSHHSPGSRDDLSDAMEDVVQSGSGGGGGDGGDSIYTSLFDLPVDMSIPGSSQFEELSSIYTALPDNSDDQAVVPDSEENMILREQIRRLNFERISSASLYAMNGIQELCLMRSGDATSGLLVGSPSSSFLSCKMLRSPGWGSGVSPGSGGEHPEGSWGAHLCRVA